MHINIDETTVMSIYILTLATANNFYLCTQWQRTITDILVLLNCNGFSSECKLLNE